MQRFLAVPVILLVLALLSPAAFGLEEQKEQPGRAYYDFGVFAFEDGDLEGALTNLKLALAANPEEPAYHHYMGKVLQGLERMDEAAAYFTKAWEEEPDLPGLRYDLGYFYFQRKDYKRAAPLFAAVGAAEPDNGLALYYAGISYYNLENFKEALDFFQKTAASGPAFELNGSFYAGLCHLRLAEFDQAQEKFEYVRDHAETEEMRLQAVQSLEAVAANRKAFTPFSLAAELTRSYDDNVMTEPLDQDLFSNEDDWVSSVYLAASYRPINRRDLVLSIGYNHYEEKHDHLKEYDLRGSILQFSLTKNRKPLSFIFSYTPSYFWVDEQDYMLQHQLGGQIAWQVRDKLQLTGGYTFSDNHHIMSKGKTGQTNQGTLGGNYTIFDNWGKIAASIAYENTGAVDPDAEYGAASARCSLRGSLFRGLQFEIGAAYEDKSYASVDSFYGVKRQDKKYKAEISLFRSVYYDWLIFKLKAESTRNNSNILDNEYRRQVYSLSMTAAY